jgi:hypothetical protein
MITSEELFNALESDTTKSNVKFVAKNLSEAINDWLSQNLSEPCELISELKLHINSKLTFEKRNGSVDKEIELEVLIDRITNPNRK